MRLQYQVQLDSKNSIFPPPRYSPIAHAPSFDDAANVNSSRFSFLNLSPARIPSPSGCPTAFSETEIKTPEGAFSSSNKTVISFARLASGKTSDEFFSYKT